VVIICTCGSAAAATLQQLSLDQMADAATAIVLGRVTSSSTSFTGSTIYTHYKIRALEIWKGSPAAEVLIPGGVAGGFRQSYPGVPTLQVGSEYVLFLWTSTKTGITHLVGLNQGIFNVAGQGSSTQVSRPAIGETVLDSSGHIVHERAVQMSMSGLKSLVAQRTTPQSTIVGATR